MDNVKNIAVFAPLTSSSGYGQYGRSISRMVVESFKSNQNVKIYLFDSNYQAMKEDKVDLNETKYKQLIEYVSNLKLIETEFFDVFISVSIPQSFLVKGLYNIGVTALAEVDIVNPKLVDSCNKVDQVWVMSKFNNESLLKSEFNYKNKEGQDVVLKINVPIKIIPHSINKDDVKSEVTEVTEFIDNIEQEYLFINVGQWLPGNLGNDRKDMGALVSTFLSTFPNSKKVGLLLKTEQGRTGVLSEYNLKQKVKSIVDSINKNGGHIQDVNVYIISGNLSQEQMVQIYNHKKVKTFVSFTHGESFGIPIMQYSLFSEKPLLIPYHSGMVDYIEPQNVQVLIHNQVQVPQELFGSFYKDFMLPKSKWFTINYKHASYKMKQMVDKYDMYLERGKEQSLSIQNNFNTQIISKRVFEEINKQLIDED